MTTTLTDHIVRIAETWQRVTIALDLARNGMTEDVLREIVDSKNAHVAALDLAVLASFKVGHGPVLERAKARAARCL
jgi:hypothetical protein